MSEILEATAENGEVKVVAGTVSGCRILSAGKAKSSGVILLIKGQKVYVAIPMDSISKILDLMADLANKVGSGVVASNAGGPVAPDLMASMQSVAQEIKQLKGNLQ